MDEVNRKKEFASPRMTGLKDKSQRRVLSEEKLSVSLVVGCCMQPVKPIDLLQVVDFIALMQGCHQACLHSSSCSKFVKIRLDDC